MLGDICGSPVRKDDLVRLVDRVAGMPVADVKRLPGVPKSNLFASIRWGGEVGWQANATGQYISSIAVNDVNTVLTPSYALFGLSGGYGLELPSYHLTAKAQAVIEQGRRLALRER